MTELIDLLKEKHLKVTPQRLAIFTMLFTTNTHPDAETVYKTLKPHNPSLSLATVYKTLDSLRAAALLQELNVGEGRFRYDANCDHHPHFICRQCTRVYDVPELPGLKSLRTQAAKSLNANIDREQLFFYGTCNACGAAQKA